MMHAPFRLARFTMAGSVLGPGIPKAIFLGFIQSLPDDVSVVGFGQDWSRNTSFIVLESERFEPCVEGKPIPELDVTFKVEERKTERMIVSVSVGSAFLQALEVKTETIKEDEVKNATDL